MHIEKICPRCGSVVKRKVMATAKYCSGACRDAATNDRWRKAKALAARKKYRDAQLKI